jgi:hypothetical protein
VALDKETALERLLSSGDEWQSWRALRVSGEDPGAMPKVPDQEELGSFAGASGRASPGETGLALCHLVITGAAGSGAGAIAGDWLEAARTPAEAWLDAPSDVPGEVDEPAAGRVWATASAACGLLAVGRSPGTRALDLLRGEADNEGRFTGGAYPTFAAAGAYWLGEGPKTEMAEWALRWCREWAEEWWEAWERVVALTYWGAAGVPLEQPSVDRFLDELLEEPAPEGWDDIELTLRALELTKHYAVW